MLTDKTLLVWLLQGYLPFAVVGSMEKVKIGNKMVRARQYPWGIVKGKGILKSIFTRFLLLLKYKIHQLYKGLFHWCQSDCILDQQYNEYSN